MTERPGIDVTDLPTHASGPTNPLWWGTLGFVTIEGLGFIFAFAVYLYLYTHNLSWPLGPQPGLFWSTALTLLILASEIPSFWLRRAAYRKDLQRVRVGLLIMSAVGLAAILLRAFELTTLNIRWDANAYGSIVWFLIGLHTAHLATDVGETLVMTVLSFIGPVDMRRFAEVEDNQDYWDFVVVSWLAVYAAIYWFPRWFEVTP